ncbi:hypothetical protein CRENBAI_014750 [Crenichthys baileyi]|uniref:Uncharacterized protein n=1 Tax=Crenichthys baileyi TaxID=28760 RepID=A0AAV9R856_9TELE
MERVADTCSSRRTRTPLNIQRSMRKQPLGSGSPPRTHHGHHSRWTSRGVWDSHSAGVLALTGPRAKSSLISRARRDLNGARARCAHLRRVTLPDHLLIAVLQVMLLERMIGDCNLVSEQMVIQAKERLNSMRLRFKGGETQTFYSPRYCLYCNTVQTDKVLGNSIPIFCNIEVDL